MGSAMTQRSLLMAQRKQLGITGILREAFRCLHGNPKLLLSSLLLVLIPLNHLRTLPTLNPQLVLNATYIATLLRLNKLTTPETKRFNILSYPVGLIISHLTEFTAVYFSFFAYNGRNFRIEELRSKCKRTWKGSIITLLCARFIPFAFGGLHMILGALLQKMEASSTRVALFMIVLSLMILLAIFFLYVGMVAKVSLVVSIVEEGCYGLPALRRAGSLIRGRKLHGFALMVLRILLGKVLSLVIGAIAVDRRRGDGWQLSVITKVVATILLRSLVVSLSVLYSHLVYTVYYYECKRSHEKGRGEEEQGLYKLIPFTSHVDALP